MGHPIFIAAFIQILLLLPTQIVKTKSENITSRIIGGDEIDISQAKFAVQVISNNSSGLSLCSGSLVSRFYVITAAHCVKHVPLANITVIGGATYFPEEGTQRSVSNKHLPEDPSWDIAVLRLQTPLAGPNIEVIKMCNTQCRPGDLINAYGWGKTTRNDNVQTMTKQKLRQVELPVVDEEECELYYGGKVHNNYFCAGVYNEKDAAEGDSGGPAVLNNCLCGVVSSGSDYVGLSYYVDISSVKSFIQAVIKFEDYDLLMSRLTDF